MEDISELARRLGQRADEKRMHADRLARSQDSTDRLVNAIGDVKLDMPEGFKLDWGISINGLKELLLGLDLTMDQVKKLTNELPAIVEKLDKNAGLHKEAFAEIAKAIRSIKQPEVIVPEPLAEVKVTDLNKVVDLLKKLVAKPDFECSDIMVPDFPTSITVDNLSEVVEKLDALLTMDRSDEQEREPIGYSWTKDSTGKKLFSFTEIYSDHKVTSSGWNIGRVSITNDKTD